MNESNVVELNGTVEPVAEKAITRAPARAPMGFTPKNLEEGWRLAEWLSKSGLLPKQLIGKPSDILVVMMKGLELGLQPMQAFGSIHVIEGKPVCSAQLLVALVKSSPACEYFRLSTSTATAAVYESKRYNNPPVRMSFTIEEAEKAGLVKKDNWAKYPAAMLRNRAASHLCMAEWSDVTHGMQTDDEAREIHDVTPSVTVVPDVADPEVKGAPIAPVSRVAQVAAKVAGKVAAQQAPAAPPTAQAKKLDARCELIAGPMRGAAISGLSAEELADAVSLFEAKIRESVPSSTWLPEVKTCLEALQGEQEKRMAEIGGEA